MNSKKMLKKITPLIMGLVGDDKLTKRMVELRYLLLSCLAYMITTIVIFIIFIAFPHWWIILIGVAVEILLYKLLLYIGDILLEALYGRDGRRDENGDMSFVDSLMKAFDVPQRSQLS